jgi:Na+/glutamate symporter
MYNKVDLVSLHFVSDLIIAISYLIIGNILYRIYRVFKDLKLPWKGFLWMFGGFISMCGVTHLIGVLNIWITFYWIDGLFKMFTAVFSAGVALTLWSDMKSIMEMEVDFKMMAEKLSNIIHEAEDKYQQITKAQTKNGLG